MLRPAGNRLDRSDIGATVASFTTIRRRGWISAAPEILDQYWPSIEALAHCLVWDSTVSKDDALAIGMTALAAGSPFWESFVQQIDAKTAPLVPLWDTVSQHPEDDDQPEPPEPPPAA